MHGVGEPRHRGRVTAPEVVHHGVSGAPPGQVEVDQRAVLVEEDAG